MCTFLFFCQQQQHYPPPIHTDKKIHLSIRYTCTISKLITDEYMRIANIKLAMYDDE